MNAPFETSSASATRSTTCPYCGVGCGILARPRADGDVETVGDTTHPANFGRLCSKGSALSETLEPASRLLHPEVDGRCVSWPEALDRIAGDLKRIRDRHGPEAIAFYLSGQLLTEDYYVANKLAKGFIGTPHVDTNSRLCMASSVAGHKRAFGEDVVPQCYEDLEEADVVVLAGSNAAWCHPVLYQRIMAAKKQRGTKVVVIDPRRTATCEGADLHLAISPGTDQHLWNGLLVALADRDLIASRFVAAHTTGLDAALKAARRSLPNPRATAASTGLKADDVAAFFELWCGSDRVVSCYSQGINQSRQGTDKVNAILNCHLATGRIGRPGSGPLSLTGQPNAMGGREVGGLANTLAAHMGFTPSERATVARFWNAPNLVAGEGLKAVDMFDAIADGRIKALWVMGTNPAVSLPRADHMRALLSKLDVFVVSENVTATDTAEGAHVRLPATAWSEKDGTVTNSERRISRQRAFKPAAGEARADWWILAQVAARLGYGRAFGYAGPAEIFREHAALSGFENGGKRVFDISALAHLSDQAYNTLSPVLWPVTSAKPDGVARLFANGRFPTADGRARIITTAEPALAQTCDDDRPLLLNTGRIRDQWHTMTRTGLAPRLSSHIGEPFVALAPETAARFDVREGEIVQLAAKDANFTAPARIDDGLADGHVFAPIHWSRTNASNARVGAIVAGPTDPISGQPEAKATPVGLTKPYLSLYGTIASCAALTAEDTAYWCRISAPFGSIMQIALDPHAEPANTLERTLPAGKRVVFVDAARQDRREAVFIGDRLHALAFLKAEPFTIDARFLEAAFADTYPDGAAPGPGRAQLRSSLAGSRPDRVRLLPGRHRHDR